MPRKANGSGNVTRGGGGETGIIGESPIELRTNGQPPMPVTYCRTSLRSGGPTARYLEMDVNIGVHQK
ncbi:MAG: hypothetical protein ABEH86_13545 [Haloarcula sp.]